MDNIEPVNAGNSEIAEETEDIFVDSSEVSDIESKKSGQDAAPENEDKQQEPEWLDPVFKTEGKSIEEAIKEQAKSYKEAVKKWQEAAREAAEHRKLIDAYILDSLRKASISGEKEVPRKTVFEEELGLDGNAVRESLLQILAPVLKPLFDEVAMVKGKMISASVREEVLKANPDHFAIVNSPEFAEWVTKNYPPKIVQIADSDPELASDIVTRFKAAKKSTVNPVTKKPQFTEPSTPPVGEKIWSRAELIRMQREDPERYAANQKEIMRAYAEGRVK